MICEICNENFSKGSMDIHLKIVHNYVRQKNCSISYKCDEDKCFRLFSDKKSLQRHKKNAHSSQNVSADTTKTEHFENKNVYDESDSMYFTKDFDINNCGKCDCCDENFEVNSNCESEINGGDVFECDIENCFCNKSFTDVSLTKIVLEITSNLYSENSLSRSHSTKVINMLHEFLNSDYLNSIKFDISNKMQDPQKREIIDKLENFQSSFSEILSDHKRQKLLEKCGLLIRPEAVFLGTREDLKDGKVIMKRMYAQYIPIDLLLKRFLESEGVYDMIMSYHEYLLNTKNENELIHIIQTEFWKNETKNYENCIVLPLYLYEDAFEPGNPLRPTAGLHKLNGVYISVACLPPDIQSKLRNIFVAMLYYVQDLEKCSREIVFVRLVDCLKTLESEGIIVNLKNNLKVKVYFKLALIIGDNLGLNSIMGFVESFSAKYFCRICKSDKSVTQKMYEEDVTTLRNKCNYDEDIITDNYKLTGIKNEPIFHQLQDFHVTKNKTVDITHDFLEGICCYELLVILKYFIKKKKLFSLKSLNWRIQFFNMNNHNIRPPLISELDLSKDKIKMTASQMLTFVLSGGVLFGDFVSDKNDHYWKLYTLLRKIVYLIFLPRVTKDTIAVLKSTIADHHKLWVKISNDFLKPKHHLGVHYHMMMSELGPLRNFSTLRWEGKHLPIKRYCHVTFNRKDLCYSAALKHQLTLCELFLEKKSFVSLNITYTNFKTIIWQGQSCKFNFNGVNYLLIKQINIDNFVLKKESIVLTHFVNDCPCFGKILNVYKIENIIGDALKDFAVDIIQFSTTFDEDVQAFLIDETSNQEFVLLHNLALYKTFNVNLKEDRSYIIFTL